MSSEVEIHVIDLLPAFVLDSLTDEETGQVAEHLAGCQTCQAELLRLQLVADELPLALVQSAPPPRVKENLMRKIHERNLMGTGYRQQTNWEKFVDFFRRPLPALGITLIVLMAFGNILLWRQLNLTSHQPNTAMRVVALANTQDAPGAIGTMIVDPHGMYGSLVVDSLTILDPGHQYQVWLIKGSQRTSGGLFSVNKDGYASLEIQSPLPLLQYDSIGITIEPAGGSPGPTGKKVLGGSLTQ